MTIAELEAVWRERRSIRAFTDQAVPTETLVEIFAAAQTAPSWCNIQPWRVTLTTPPKTAALAAAMQAAARAGLPQAEVPFPLDYPSPYKEHRIHCGAALYRAIGVQREDKLGRYDAWLRNYAFFDAPHVAIVACDRRLGPYAYIDVGIWLGYVLTATTAAGLATCPMASVAAYPRTLREHLPIADSDVVLFGLAIGYPSPGAPANETRTTREPIEANLRVV